MDSSRRRREADEADEAVSAGSAGRLGSIAAEPWVQPTCGRRSSRIGCRVAARGLT